MLTSFRRLLAASRAAARSERDKGAWLEKIAVVFLKHDHGMAQEYEGVWPYKDWAKQRGLSAADTGIDVVAKIRGEDSYCAVQCKFYGEGSSIAKAEVNSFLSTLGGKNKKYFSRGLLIETTGRPLSDNASENFDAYSVTVIGLDRLEGSDLDWDAFFQHDEVRVARPPKTLRAHQKQALKAVQTGLATAERGKLIMACGTGKTFTSLKIAEAMGGKDSYILVLMPSLALMNQTIYEWSIDSSVPLRSFAVCSDAQVGKRTAQSAQDDRVRIGLHDLDIPASTNAVWLARRAAKPSPERMTVVFSTYQSLKVLHEAQQLRGVPKFDLIICDEAHRTTGATLDGQDASSFVKIHEADYIAGEKRLYMTATPRIFGVGAKDKAKNVKAELASMDDEQMYGKDLFVMRFGDAVEEKLLTDYKVVVLAVDETMVSGSVQKRLADGTSELKLDDATKIIGCYKALLKSGLQDELKGDTQPMRRALAFCKTIKSSKVIQKEFEAVVREYRDSSKKKQEHGEQQVSCHLRHVDGTMGAQERAKHIEWLRTADTAPDSAPDTAPDSAPETGTGSDSETAAPSDSCRILTNVRCLSEGVDVPALDAILFMHPRKSQIEVVQSVGRVMRRAEGKRMGYVILPIAVSSGESATHALDNNKRYSVVWQVLNALRSHDERLDATINKMALGEDVTDRIEVTAIVNTLPSRTSDPDSDSDIGGESAAEDKREKEGDSQPLPPMQGELELEIIGGLRAKIVEKCGTREYWEDWAKDIAKIAQTHISRITGIIGKGDTSHGPQGDTRARAVFDSFLAEIRDDLNPQVTEGEAIEMLAQHLITRPVFDALFEGDGFTKHNPVSKAMQKVLAVLDAHNISKETGTLEKFYASVRRRSEGIKKASSRQQLILELYDKFFRGAFPKTTERLGIVYTPIQVVDFILHSVNELLQSEFTQTLGKAGVHILDPFTGTGTFITRLLQSGLITPEELEHKYRKEIHANEFILLAYYIAAINIETVHHELQGGDYEPFAGICLTDTFQMDEQKEDLLSEIFPVNSERRTRQMGLPVKVIIGNPPYSTGQKSANDNAQNIAYTTLDTRIRATYAERSEATSLRNLYDSYIRALCWASDRIGTAGVIGFVTNAGWLDGNAMDGLRKCLAEEFTSIHIINLRGNQRTSGELSRREGGKIFGGGSRTPIAITLLVKNPKAEKQGKIYYHDIGDYLRREEKLGLLDYYRSIGGIAEKKGWQTIIPNEFGDWLNPRDRRFDTFIPLGDKKGQETKIFDKYSCGIATGRDSWAYHFSRAALAENMQRMIRVYNDERTRFAAAYPTATPQQRKRLVDTFVDTDPSKISWSRALKGDLAKNKPFSFADNCLTPSLYRPFTKQFLYYNRAFNEMVYQMPRIFPMGAAAENRVICVSGVGAMSGFSALMSNALPCLDMIEKGQCFPRYFYTPAAAADAPLDPSAGDPSGALQRHDAISDEALAHFQAAWPGESISKDDIFDYIYGLLHSEDYRRRFGNSLTKQLPRIPAVSDFGDFRAFVAAGHRLGDLHCDYEKVKPYPVSYAQGMLELRDISDPQSFYRTEKMKFPGKMSKKDKSKIIYNDKLTLTGIPLSAYDYVVNGKAALDWVMERQCVKTDKKSCITNDANRYAIETVGDPAYPLLLLRRVLRVSLETLEIIGSLPALKLPAEHGSQVRPGKLPKDNP